MTMPGGTSSVSATIGKISPQPGPEETSYTPPTFREIFTELLHTGPALAVDAVVVLCGEDGDARLRAGLENFRQNIAEGYAPAIVLSGGIDTPPSKLGAVSLHEAALGAGVANGKIITDETSTNTREQAVNIAKMAADNGWRRIALVVSPYHAQRAFLTMLKALQELQLDDTVRITLVSANQTRWGQSPPGVEATRYDLRFTEIQKLEQYIAKGDVADYEHGVNYLRKWDGK